ncbi:MAG: TonB-dependent receptor, partial [Acidobacteria bacterium]|nr:TonB-dependent receptor [Acidobacteriota bacterium]
GARLELRNLGQNRSWTSTANDVGEYLLVQIPPGTYALTAEAQGFKRYERTAMTLQVAQVAVVNLTLEVGEVTETIEVEAEAPLLETGSSALSEVVNSRSAEALPLNGRMLTQLVALAPGVNTSYGSRTTAIGADVVRMANYSVNGGRTSTNAVLLDGSPQDVNGEWGQPAYVPTPDAVQEFRVQTNATSAEYGRTGGAVINMVHRSGTSDFHGNVYEFLRNDVFDANSFFSNKAGRARPPLRFNQFGFTFGGPLTASRNSTFFFGSYEGLRDREPRERTLTVPTIKMRNGDFSELPGPIYDPATIDSSGRRQAFAGNVIPRQRLNPVALNLLSFYPQPTTAGLANNFFGSATRSVEDNNVSLKIDRRISARQDLFVRYSAKNPREVDANFFGNFAFRDARVWGAPSYSVTVDDTYTTSGGWVLHGNYGYGRHRFIIWRHEEENFSLASFGFPSSLDRVKQKPWFPLINLAGVDGLGNNSIDLINEHHVLIGDGTKSFGRHTVKFGGQYRVNRNNFIRTVSPAGAFNFDQGWTREFFNFGGGGHSVASMLLGLMSGGNIGFVPTPAAQTPYVATYFQDDWKVSRNLTLNLGLRWDSDRPVTERFDRLAWFDSAATVPIQPPGLGTVRGGLRFVDPDNRSNKTADNNNFAPRLG